MAVNEKMIEYGRLGFPYEEEAISVFRNHHDFIVKRADSSYLRNPDYLIKNKVTNYQFYLDPKVRKTPFRKLGTFLGLNPSDTVTIDTYKLSAYRKVWETGIPVFLLFNVRYDEWYKGERYQRVGEYIISMQKIIHLAIKYGKKRLLNEKDHEKNKDLNRFYILIEEMGTYDQFLWNKFEIAR